MEAKVAVRALAALAQQSRLEVFQALARVAPDGLPAGELARRLGLPASTLSFHLQHLLGAGLVHADRQGRSIRYSLRERGLRELLWFLGEDCCQGRVELCVPPTERIDARMEEAGSAERPAVLFLCSRNSARSQIAEALLKREAGDRFDVFSGGIEPRGVHPMTTRVLEEVGLDATQARSKDLSEFLGKVSIHYAIVVCEAANAECPRIQPFALHNLYWPFPDPVALGGSDGDRLEAFRRVRDGLEKRIRAWLRSKPSVAAARQSPA